MNQQQNTVLLIYRMVGDRRIPYHLELDATMTVVSDRPNLELLRAQALAEQQSTLTPTDQLNTYIANQTRNAQDAAVVAQQSTPAPINQPNTHGANQMQHDQTAAVEALINEATLEGHVVQTTDPNLIQKFPNLSPATQHELAPSMKGEILEERKLPNGGTQIVYKPTPADITMGTWVTDLVTENPIPGTDEMRAEYFAEVADLMARHAQNGTVCKSCETGAVMRKWRAKLEALGFIK